MRLAFALATAALLSSSLAARAESITYDFNFTGQWVDFVPTVASALAPVSSRSLKVLTSWGIDTSRPPPG